MGIVRFATGLSLGFAIPMIAHENIYLTIATCFLRPHLKYQIGKEKRDRNRAVPIG